MLELLKRRGPQTASTLAGLLGLTPTALRQHLASLESRGLVARERDTTSAARGRPSSKWALTDAAGAMFPDRHADLTVEVLDAVRRTLGPGALDMVIETRRRDQLKAYRDAVPPSGGVARQAKALARQRTAEGYMAEAVPADDGSWLLVEHHCPIADAAASCQGLCGAELKLFRQAVGPDVVVDRERHLLSGDAHCAYRLRKRP